MSRTLTLRTWDDVRDGFRVKPLRQALYDEGAVVMGDCLLDLHGDEHRARRRLENRLFRRDMFRLWERAHLGATIDAVLAPGAAAGRGDLIVIGYRTTMELTALVAGLDRPEGTTEELDALDALVRTFSEGATLVHSTRDRDEVRSEVEAALHQLDVRFLSPSRARRQALLDAHFRGELAEAALPRDVLTTLLRSQDDLRLPPDVVRREIAFYLQAGSHSTANAFTHTLDSLFGWADRSDRGADLVAAARASRVTRDHRLLLQRCVHETLRLFPASPVAWRRPVANGVVCGNAVDPTTLVVLDLESANRDPAVWGADADAFDPCRVVPDGVPPWGHSFGGGAHACIGAELDGGTDAREQIGDDHLFGTVAVMAEAVLGAGARPDPDHPPVQDPTSTRRHFSSYPVVFSPERP